MIKSLIIRTCTALILATLFLQTVQSQSQEKYTGLWLGILRVIEQNAFDIPMDACEIVLDTVRISFNAAGITYTGVYSLERDSIRGTYEQEGGRLRR